jgi:hypothetical protein
MNEEGEVQERGIKKKRGEETDEITKTRHDKV